MRGEERYFEFVYTPSFEVAAKKLLTEEDRRHLELLLLDNPERGALIERTGGFRKVRFGRPSRREGRSGGTRVIYFFAEGRGRIFLLLIYSKGTRDTLTRAEENELRRLGQTLKGG